MYFYIKEWSNKTATLMSDNGTVLWTFHSVEEAQAVCKEWYRIQEDRVHYHREEVNFDPTSACCAVG